MNKPSTLSLIFTISAAFCLFTFGASSQQAPALAPRWTPVKSNDATVRLGRDAKRIILKITDDAGASAENGRLRVKGRPALAPIAQLLQKAGAKIEPLFEAPAERLYQYRAVAERNSGARHADLSQYFSITISNAKNSQNLLSALLARPEVENAYYAALPAPPPGNSGNPVTPDITFLQSYRSAAPVGVDAVFAENNTPPSTGNGVRIVDIERAWNLNHEDLSNRAPAALIGPAPVPSRFSQINIHDENHGAAVLGILGADRDAHGITGIAPDSRLRAVTTTTKNGENVANSILFAMDHLQIGDVILIEAQTPGPNYGNACSAAPAGTHDAFAHGLVPVEYNDAEFDVIKTATAIGFHVVEAAGNGSQDLDQLNNDGSGCSKGDPSYIKFQLEYRDSGAILVAAATSAGPHLPLASTNVGSRVDCYAWGENVATLGFGDLTYQDPNLGPVVFDKTAVGSNVNKYYTHQFGGTSAAAAIVAACAGVLEAKHALLYSYPYRTENMRTMMRTSGTPSADPRIDRIGSMPNLRSQLQTVASLHHASLTKAGSAHSHFGTSVAFAGVGFTSKSAHIAAGAPEYQNGTGRVDLVHLTTGELLNSWTGTSAGDLFGFSVASAGDVDGDGAPELIVGAPGGGGSIYIQHYQSDAPLYHIIGTGNDNYGWSVAGGADLSGAGHSDFIVGTPAGQNNGSIPGTVTIHSGSSGAGILTLPGTENGGYFGYSLAIAGDLNMDGTPDVIVGSPGTKNLAGSVSLVSGANGNILKSWNGQVAGDQFGLSVAGVGDANSDGVADVAIGAPFVSISGPECGRFYCISGQSGEVLFRVTGTPYERMGYAVAAAGDVNRDSFFDIIAGAPGTGNGDISNNNPGDVYVYSGSNGKLVELYHGEVNGDAFGTSVAGFADADENNVVDLLIGAPFSKANGNDSGRIYSVLRDSQTKFGLASFGTGTAGCEGPQFTFGDSTPRAGNSEYQITCSNAPPSALGILIITNAYSNDGYDATGHGVLWHVDLINTTELFILPILSNIAGGAAAPVPIPNNPLLVGRVFIAQAFWSWAGAPGPMCYPTYPVSSAMSSSNALWMSIQPSLGN
ncbi:MAG: S8 family serine peptidase [Planctomycetota bacterium]